MYREQFNWKLCRDKYKYVEQILIYNFFLINQVNTCGVVSILILI